MKNFGILLALLLIGIGCSSSPKISTTVLFENGTGPYQCYRIPALIKTQDGTLLAFIEGRKTDCADFGDVDLLMRSSKDGGLTWSAPSLLVDNGTLQVGNPAPVLDQTDPNYPQGRLFLFYNTGTASEHEVRLGNGERRVAFITSTDQGTTWSTPTDITSSVHFNASTGSASLDWRTHANTPGHALQLTKGNHKGRIYIPANHSTGDPQDHFNEYRSYGFYSDDHGESWHTSVDVPVPSSNEAIGAELPNGELMLNIREQNGETKRRLIALSKDGGATWYSTYFDEALVSPVCQSGLLFFEGKNNSYLVYSGPNSETKREKMTLKFSTDYGKTWAKSFEVYAGESAYSDLVQIDGDHLGILYEEDQKRVVFVKVNPGAVPPD